MKFSIRDLLLVTVIVALAVGWWVDHNRASNVAFRQLQQENYKLKIHASSIESLLRQYGWEMKVEKDFKNGWRTRFSRPGAVLPTSSAPAQNPAKD